MKVTKTFTVEMEILQKLEEMAIARDLTMNLCLETCVRKEYFHFTRTLEQKALEQKVEG